LRLHYRKAQRAAFQRTTRKLDRKYFYDERDEMKNVEMKVDGQKLIITVDLSKEFGKSSSGKTTIIATTAGNVSVPGHDEIKIGLNCYK
jgi:hypothetical protein